MKNFDEKCCCKTLMEILFMNIFQQIIGEFSSKSFQDFSKKIDKKFATKFFIRIVVKFLINFPSVLLIKISVCHFKSMKISLSITSEEKYSWNYWCITKINFSKFLCEIFNKIFRENLNFRTMKIFMKNLHLNIKMKDIFH